MINTSEMIVCLNKKIKELNEASTIKISPEVQKQMNDFSSALSTKIGNELDARSKIIINKITNVKDKTLVSEVNPES